VLLNEKNTSLIDKISSYDCINAYFDNDATGKKCTEKLAKICNEKGISFQDKSSLYTGYNDYNEFLVSKKNEKQVEKIKPLRKLPIKNKVRL